MGTITIIGFLLRSNLMMGRAMLRSIANICFILLSDGSEDALIPVATPSLSFFTSSMIFLDWDVAINNPVRKSHVVCLGLRISNRP